MFAHEGLNIVRPSLLTFPMETAEIIKSDTIGSRTRDIEGKMTP